MHRNRRPLALVSIVSLVALLAAVLVLENVELGGGNDVGTAIAGIEGEGDIPLPVA